MKSFKIQYLVFAFLLAFLISCNQRNEVVVGISIGPVHERWSKDSDFLKESLEKNGAKVKIHLANGVDSIQAKGVQELLDWGIDVLIIAPVNSVKASGCVDMAKEAGVKVIAYDRIIKNCDLDFYISFDNVKVGELQAGYLTKIKPTGNYALLGGSPTDDNSSLLRLGQMTVLQPLITKGDINIVLDQYISRWDSDVAYEVLNSHLNKDKNIDAVIASSDAIAKGAYKALAKHKLDATVLLSGQDAELEACQRIVQGKQTMTVYKFIESLAHTTANVAIALAKDEGIPNSYATVNNGSEMVPSILLQSMIQVTNENIRMTVIADGYLDEKQIFATDDGK